MADSVDKKQPISPNNFADDLDSMLDDAASSIDSDELMNDDDAIDKLLMESAFDEQESFDDEDDLGQLFADDLVAEDSLNDEFGDESDADDELPRTEAPSAQSARSVELKEDPVMAEIDEFSDFDEFADTEPLANDEHAVSPAKEEQSEARAEPELDNDDFTLVEFDISGLEDDSGEFAVNPDGNKTFGGEEVERPGTSDDEIGNQEQGLTELGPAGYDDASPLPEKTPEPVDQKVVDDVVTTQIYQLFSEQEILKEQISSLRTSKDSGHSEAIARLSMVQNQFKKQLENSLKTPVITFVALGMAAVAFLTAAVFAYMNLSSTAEIESLTELVGTLEENQAELNALLNKNSLPVIAESSVEPLVSEGSSAETKEESIEPLTPTAPASAVTKNDGVGSPVTLPTGLAIKDETVSVESAKKAEQTQTTPATETPEKNDQVAALEAKIKELEDKLANANKVAPQVNKAATKPHAPVRRSPPKTSVPAASWSVNLISFKQDWYADRKAAEFSRQGVPVKVVPVQVKGETWYRLSVAGFKSREEASAYAAMVKRAHNLDSVWIARD